MDGSRQYSHHFRHFQGHVPARRRNQAVLRYRQRILALRREASADLSIPGQGQGEGPVGSKLSRSDDADDNGRGRRERSELSSAEASRREVLRRRQAVRRGRSTSRGGLCDSSRGGRFLPVWGGPRRGYGFQAVPENFAICEFLYSFVLVPPFARRLKPILTWNRTKISRI